MAKKILCEGCPRASFTDRLQTPAGYCKAGCDGPYQAVTGIGVVGEQYVVMGLGVAEMCGDGVPPAVRAASELAIQQLGLGEPPAQPHTAN